VTPYKRNTEAISEQVFMDHITGLEKFCYSIVELEPNIASEDLLYNEIMSEGFFNLVREAMTFLNINTMTFYYVQKDVVEIKRISVF